MSNNILFLNKTPLIYRGIMIGFQDNGWNTYILEGEDHVMGQSAEIQINMISKYVEEHNIDVVFSEFGVGIEFKAIYDYCESKGICYVIWAIEDTPNVSCWLDQTIKYCHYYFTTTEELIPYAKENFDKDIDLLMFGVEPSFHKPSPPNKDIYPWDVVLVGNNYSSRYDKMKWFMQPALSGKYDTAIFGNVWWMDCEREFNISNYPDIYKGYFAYDDLPSLYSTCPVVLGVNCNGDSLTQTSMRPYEFAGMSHNSCLVSFYTKAQENIFGDLIYLPRNAQETEYMIDEVLNMTDAQRIFKSNKLREFCYKNHNYKDRAKIVINRIKNGGNL